MIRTLTGTVIETMQDSMVVEVAGIGYHVQCTPSTTTSIEPNNNIHLWIHHAVSDSSINLYGFIKQDELTLFELLLTVSGIGPKKALSILAISESSSLKRAISSGETKHVTDVTGVGKKVADKIILELQNKIKEWDTTEYDGEIDNIPDTDTVEALTSLGYSSKEARDAVQRIPSDITETSERIKEALKQIR